MQTTPFNRDITEPFLADLGYDPANPVGLELRLLKEGSAPRIIRPVPRMQFWVDLVKAQEDGYNVYFGVCARGDGPGGGKDNVVQAACTWADVDGKTFDLIDISRGKTLAMEYIRKTLPQELWPSLIVDSGHGYHCYWILASPYAFDQDGSREYFEDLLHRIALLLKGDPSVAETARVMRLPGSWNLKDPANPLPCRVIEANPDRTFSIGEFENAIPRSSESSGEYQYKSERTGGKSSPSKKTMEFLLFGAPEGDRNNRAFEAAADLAGCGFSEEETFQKILDAASRCGLPEAEAQNAVRSAYKKDRFPSTGYSTSPPPPDATGADTDAALNELPLTDAGQAEAFVLLYGDRVRHVHEQGKWFTYNGNIWKPDHDGEVYRLAIEAARRRQQAAVNSHHPSREKILRWSLGCENRYRLDSMLKVASNMNPLSCSINNFDKNPWLLGCPNGVLDLKTGDLRTGRPTDFISLSTGVDYNPDAEALRFQQALSEIFPGNVELLDYIHRAIGYSLTGLTIEQVFFICYGSGANGKTTLLNLLLKVFGDYGKNTPATTLLADPRGPRSQSNDLAALKGARLVTASEVSANGRLDEARVKVLSGGDSVTARFLFHEYMTYDPHYKIFLAVNHKPIINETTVAIWRRVVVLPFIAHFPEGKSDKYLVQKLTEEGPGILSWAVQGCLKWQKHGLIFPVSVRDATRNYRQEMDILGQFLDACTIPIPGARVRSSELYDKYLEWCSRNGLHPWNNIRFSRALEEKGIRREKHGFVYFIDIGLPSDQGVEVEDWEGQSSIFT